MAESAVLVQEHAGLLDAMVMFGGYPQTRCQYDQVANAQELRVGVPAVPSMLSIDIGLTGG